MQKVLIIISIYFLCVSAEAKTLLDKVELYKNKYKAECLSEKITDNRGNGFEDLYGTRNMKTILFGIAYRGGANNFYHKENKRDNSNPLPNDGLQNLLDEGFSAAIYLYATNFSSAPKELRSKDNKDTLKYYYNGLNTRESIKSVLLMVKEVIENPEKGPIYLHCWNGWHQSGFISACILMQFCGYTNQEALEYWTANTDGNHKGYDKVKKRILEFEIFDDIKIDEKLKKQICPCSK